MAVTAPHQRVTLPRDRVRVDVVVPVYNEEVALPVSFPKLCDFLERSCPYDWCVVIADNASTDDTLAIALRLSMQTSRVEVAHLERKGRGRALRLAWLTSDADVVSYMDVDLSTNLDAFLPLIAPLARGEGDVGIGSRLLPASRVTRQWKREVTSRGYNLLIKLLFRNRFSDAQCGFKAVTRQVAHDLVPLIDDEAWFFDTELLLLAEARGLRIHEVPVDWVEDLDSRVHILKTALDDVRGLLRMRRRLRWRQRPNSQRRLTPVR